MCISTYSKYKCSIKTSVDFGSSLRFSVIRNFRLLAHLSKYWSRVRLGTSALRPTLAFTCLPDVQNANFCFSATFTSRPLNLTKVWCNCQNIPIGNSWCSNQPTGKEGGGNEKLNSKIIFSLLNPILTTVHTFS